MSTEEGMALGEDGRVLKKPEWYSAREYHDRVREVDFWKGIAIAREEEITRLRGSVEFHAAKADEWLTAYQNERVKSVGDYTRRFVRRPILRWIIQFLMRL